VSLPVGFGRPHQAAVGHFEMLDAAD